MERMNRTGCVEQIEKAAMVFRAQHGDRNAYDFVTVDEATNYRQANTFEEFLQVNQLAVYEEVVR